MVSSPEVPTTVSIELIARVFAAEVTSEDPGVDKYSSPLFKSTIALDVPLTALVRTKASIPLPPSIVPDELISGMIISSPSLADIFELSVSTIKSFSIP